MVVWVKEHGENFTKRTMELWVKEKIKVQKFTSIQVVDIMDVIVVSQKDKDIDCIDFERYTVLVYEEFFEKISKNIIQEHQYNYDFYYLKYALEKACMEEVDTIITGSSYGLFGIDSKMLKNEVNLCLASQDIYYSTKGIYEVCKRNKKIKNVVMCLAYYGFCSDLSKTQNGSEISRVSRVYEPLFGDLHNCKLLPPKQKILYQSDIFDITKVLDIYTRGEYDKTYFHENRSRNMLASRMWDDTTKDWIELSVEEKEVAAQRRATMHNKSKTRYNSLAENTKIFNELSSFCTENSINLVVVVTPVTKYYLKGLYPGFKEMFYDVLSEAEGVIHLMDLTDDETYVDEDFNDMDHLGDAGARKMTQSVLELLNGI